MNFFVLMVFVVLLASCRSKDEPHQHPRSDVAGNVNEIHLSDKQMQLGNISVDTIHAGNLGSELVLTATLGIDQRATKTVSARIGGRIERLYFRREGDYVQIGDKLFDLYSEELNVAKQEYILLLTQRSELDKAIVGYDNLVQAAKRKLLLWGMTESQIAQLQDNNASTPTTTFFSNLSGYLTTLNVREGVYVMDGSPIMQLAGLSTIWAEAQCYASQLSDISPSGTAIVELPDLGNRVLHGKIEFVSPEINPDTRIDLVRVSIPNPGGMLRPGMPAYVILKSPLRHTISLPSDAVQRDSKGATVWVQTAKNTFSMRMVQTGFETGSQIEITSGIHDGEIVVSTGAYLLSSEYILKHGADPMAGMAM